MHSVFDGVETLLLDLDGTLLDLAYDNYFWEELIPAAYAVEHGLDPEMAAIEVRERIARERGTLNWYSLKFWTRVLELDVLALKRSCAERIGYLDGAPAFLAAARTNGYRLVLVTNSARALLDIKHDRTGVCHHMDAVYSSEDFSAPKESQEFWRRFSKAEALRPERAVLLDDSPSVLRSGLAFGLAGVLGLTRPDSRFPARTLAGAWPSVETVRDLVPPEDD